MVFRDQTSGARFDTGSGMYGYTNSEYFAIWLAPGAYTLESIFAYNGSVAPADEPFRFVVKPGVMIYIGTVLNTWDMPPNAVERLGRPQAVKRHGRLHCPLFGSCDEKSADGSTNRYVKGPPYAQVAVFDEGMPFLERLRTAVPDLPNAPLERWLMW